MSPYALSLVFKKIRKLISLIVLVAFLATSVKNPAHAQLAADPMPPLPAPGSMVNLSPTYMPVMIKGLKVHPDNPLLFDFILDTGNSGLNINSAEFKNDSQRLIKYFLAALTIKEDDLWVNLSPYEKDRIIPQELGTTEMGCDMLAQDYILKQLTASLIYPEKDLGKKFWDNVYTQARQMYGVTTIPVNTFNKVWIVADKAKILEHNNAAYVIGSHLKVMLEEDYLALQKHNEHLRQPGDMFKPEQQGNVSPSMLPSDTGLNVKAPQGNNLTHNIASQIVRQIILPEIEKEVNKGQDFAPLRQMFYSMILASWYKLALKDAFLNQVYSNQGKTSGVLSDDPNIKEKIYRQYLKAYKKGVFNYIKEDLDADSAQIIPRKYFSGGLHIFEKKPEQLIKRVKQATPGEIAGIVGGDLAMVRTDMTKNMSTAMINTNLLELARNIMYASMPAVSNEFGASRPRVDYALLSNNATKQFDKLLETNRIYIAKDISLGRTDPVQKLFSMDDVQKKQYLSSLRQAMYIFGKHFNIDFHDINQINVHNLPDSRYPDSGIYASTVQKNYKEGAEVELDFYIPFYGRDHKYQSPLLGGKATNAFLLALLYSFGNIPPDLYDHLSTSNIPVDFDDHFTAIVGSSSIKQMNWAKAEAARLSPEGGTAEEILNEEDLISTPTDRLTNLMDALYPKNGEPRTLNNIINSLRIFLLDGQKKERFSDQSKAYTKIKDALDLEIKKYIAVMKGKAEEKDVAFNQRRARGDFFRYILLLLHPDYAPSQAKPIYNLFNDIYMENDETSSMQMVIDTLREDMAMKTIQPEINNSSDIETNFYNPFSLAQLAIDPGGIDLNAKDLGMDITREGRSIEMKFDPALLAQFQSGDFTGIVPVILRITPIQNPLTIY